ncbi:hypothetical protein Q3G72_003011 [Acer saccharum]|nr:hypothetical protein Q3G72_003011 [Acer saccharum]
MAEEVHQKYDFIDPHDPMWDCSPFIAKSDSPKHQYFIEYANQLKDTEGFHVDLIPIQSVCCTWILPQNVNSPMIIKAAKTAILKFEELNRLKGANLTLDQILSCNCFFYREVGTTTGYDSWVDSPQLQFEAAWAIPNLVKLLVSPRDDVCEQAMWALVNVANGTNDKIQAVIDVGVCLRLVEFLTHPSPFPSVLIPALRTVGNIVTGDDLQTQCIISHQALPCLLNLLTNNYKKSIKKEACWTISNITAGNKEQIHAVIEANIIGPLIHLLQNAEFDIKTEAAWAISNATSGGTHEQIKYHVSQGCIKPLCDLLVCLDPRIVTVCLEGLENILKAGEADKSLGNTGGVNVYAQMIDDAEGLEKIENLQSYDNIEIYEKAVKILETYWKDTDEGGVEG